MFQLVDVFGEGDYAGNPLAVLRLDAPAADEELQALARWMNLSETAFVLPPEQAGADYRVRIFTLDRELPFAGHPSLGSCHAWHRWSQRPDADGEFVQQCGLGLIPIRRAAGSYAFRAPPLLRTGAVEPALLQKVAAILNIEREQIVDAAWADNGPGWIALLLRDAAAVLAVNPRSGDGGRFEVGLVGPHPQGARYRFEVRAFFSNQFGQIQEDPVTGSLNAALGQWLYASGRVSEAYLARQGTRLQRHGVVQVRRDGDGQVWVGGSAQTYAEGRFTLRSRLKPGPGSAPRNPS